MAAVTEARTVSEWDDGLIEHLRAGLAPKGVGVYDTVAAKTSEEALNGLKGSEGRNYVVVLPGDVLPATARRFRPLTGQAEAAVVHVLGLHLWAESPSVLRGMLLEVRRLVAGFVPDGASDPVETGVYNSNSAYNDTLKPVRYTSYVTYQVSIDRGF